MKEKPVIGILGCGWLGLPLAKELLQLGYGVKGTTTQKSKINKLRDIGISAHIVKLAEDSIIGEVDEFLQDINCLIIDVPPGLRKNPNSSFVLKLRLLIPLLKQAHLKRIFFVSSTSVFLDTSPLSSYTETSIPNATSRNGLELIRAEELLLGQTAFDTKIIRFGGLIGPDRHPIHFLAGRKDLKNGQAPVNLIHQQDCIRLLIACLEKQVEAQIFHGVYPSHPSKELYYNAKANELRLTSPRFSSSAVSAGKYVSSEETRRILEIDFLQQP
jgi:nucleoside-diphosphate-sugar epimerase